VILYIYIFFFQISTEGIKDVMIKKIDLKMDIILFLSIMIIVIFFVFKRFFYSAKRNLFKDQAAWSAKDIKIKYSNSKEITASNENENYLKLIAEESKFFLEDQSNQEAE